MCLAEKQAAADHRGKQGDLQHRDRDLQIRALPDAKPIDEPQAEDYGHGEELPGANLQRAAIFSDGQRNACDDVLQRGCEVRQVVRRSLWRVATEALLATHICVHP